MKGSKKIMFLFTLLFCLLILGGCGKRTIYMYDTITVTSLEAEPANWKSDESLLLLADAALPSELQKAYMDLISKGCNEVVLKDPKGWQATVSSNENGIYVGDEANNLKFFQSSSGNIVEIGKVYRTLYRSEYFDGESQKAYNTIELDYSVDDPTLVKLAVTRDFSILYNTESNSYQCMRYGQIIGTSMVTNFEAAINAEKTPSAYGSNKGFIYDNEIYIPVIEKDGSNITFSIVKQSDFQLSIDSFSYVDIKIGGLEAKACEIIVN